MSAEILNLDKDQIKFLLKNHSCFTDKEVKLAAKRLAQDDFKKSSRELLSDMAGQQISMSENRLMRQQAATWNMTGRGW